MRQRAWLALASVTITLTLEGGTAHTRTVRPALPTNDRLLWIKLLHLDLEAHSPQAPILIVSLDAEPGTTSQVQLGLFSPQLPEPSRLDVTLARIRAIVGDGNVGSAMLTIHIGPTAFALSRFCLHTEALRVAASTVVYRHAKNSAGRGNRGHFAGQASPKRLSFGKSGMSLNVRLDLGGQPASGGLGRCGDANNGTW